MQEVREEHCADRGEPGEKLSLSASGERERVQRNGRREDRHGAGRAVDVEEHGHEHAGDRERPSWPAAASEQRRRGGQREHEGDDADVVSVQELARDDHRADHHRHGRID